MNDSFEIHQEEVSLMYALDAVFRQAGKDYGFTIEEINEDKVKIIWEHHENSGIFMFTAFRYEAQIAEFHVDYSALISGQEFLA